MFDNLVYNAKYYSEFALQMFFPANCMACNATVAKMGSICASCFNSMQVLTAPECSKCGEAFEYNIDFASEDIICNNCENHPPIYDCAKAIWAYDDFSSNIVKNFKFGDKTAIAPYLGKILSQRGNELIDKADIIAPVPLHYKRLRQRRYNQAALLCNHINNKYRHKLQLDLLVRTEYTIPQVELPYNKRQQNVENAFTLNQKYNSKIQDKTILLIDDVITTGATVNSCANILKSQGANEIYVLTLTKRLLKDGL